MDAAGSVLDRHGLDHDHPQSRLASKHGSQTTTETSLGIHILASMPGPARSLVPSISSVTGGLERVPYQERPVRHEYRLTDKGRDFFTVLAAMIAGETAGSPIPADPPSSSATGRRDCRSMLKWSTREQAARSTSARSSRHRVRDCPRNWLSCFEKRWSPAPRRRAPHSPNKRPVPRQNSRMCLDLWFACRAGSRRDRGLCLLSSVSDHG